MELASHDGAELGLAGARRADEQQSGRRTEPTGLQVVGELQHPVHAAVDGLPDRRVELEQVASGDRRRPPGQDQTAVVVGDAVGAETVRRLGRPAGVQERDERLRERRRRPAPGRSARPRCRSARTAIRSTTGTLRVAPGRQHDHRGVERPHVAVRSLAPSRTPAAGSGEGTGVLGAPAGLRVVQPAADRSARAACRRPRTGRPARSASTPSRAAAHS